MERTDWPALPASVRQAITAHTGQVISAQTAAGGLNSAVALLIRTATRTVFVKGLRCDHPGVVTQQREAIINPYVVPVAPRLLWPTRGAAFIDPASLALRLVAAGHTPAQAEALAASIPAWHRATSHAINIFATATARVWQEIAEADPHPWKQHMAAVANHWYRHRLHGEGSNGVAEPR